MDIDFISQILGDKWQIKIIYYCGQEKRGFNELQKMLLISRSVLTRKLNNLIVGKILTKVEYGSGKSKKIFYKITENGLKYYNKLSELNYL